jgi:hypothetical protein
VQVACRLADLLGFGVNRPSNPSNFAEVSSTLPEWARKKISAQLGALQDTITKEIQLFEGSQATPLASPGVIVDSQEPEEGPSACRSAHDVPGRMSSLPNSRRIIAGGILAAIVLVLSVVLFLQR